MSTFTELPDLAWWARLLGLLAVEPGLLVGLTAVAAQLWPQPQRRRALWQACLFGIAVAWFAELAGVRGWLRAPEIATAPGREFYLSYPENSALGARVESSLDAGSVAPPRPTDRRIEAEPRSIPVLWPAWFWLAGTVWFSGILVVSRTLLTFRVRRWVHGASGAPFPPKSVPGTPSDLDSISSEVAQLQRALGLRPVRVLHCPDLASPVAFGILRPTVALPSDFAARFTPLQCRAMLAHELAHLAGRDPAWLGCADFLRALAWWHPAVWWARRQLRVATEAAADEASALIPQGPVALAESLVRYGHELTIESGLGVAGSGLRSELAQRVTRLLESPTAWHRPGAAGRWLPRGLALGTVGSLLLAPLGWGTLNSPAATLARAAHALDTPDSSPARTPAPDPFRGNSVPEAQPSQPRDPASRVPAEAEASPRATLISPEMRGFKFNYSTGFESLEIDRLPRHGWTYGADTIDAGPRSALWSFYPLPRDVNLPTNLIGAPSKSAPGIWHLGKESDQFVPFSTPANPGVSTNLIRSPKHLAEVVAARAASAATPATEPQVLLKIYFAEITVVPGDRELGLDWLFGVSPKENPAVETVRGSPIPSGVEIPEVGNLRVDRQTSTNQWAPLTASQFAALKQRLEATRGVEFVAAPRVSTLNGRQAQVAVLDVHNIVTGVATEPTTNRASGVSRLAANYQTTPLGSGPVIDVTPVFSDTGWSMRLVAAYQEFLGYDDPGRPELHRGGNGQEIRVQTPLPRMRSRQIHALARCAPGEIIALRGPLAETPEPKKASTAVRGATGLGRLARDLSRVASKSAPMRRTRFYVFIEPIAIDASGNPLPIHPR